MHYYYFNTVRSNLKTEWIGSDKIENYSSTQRDGSPNYSKTDISYSFNHEGFRSDDFTLHSDFPIMFMGASVTEGIGLNVVDTWPAMILSNIQQTSRFQNSTIPLWNLGLGGTGIDAVADFLHIYSPVINPKLIIILEAGGHRRSILHSSLGETDMIYPWMPMNTDISSRIIYTISDDKFQEYQTYRSLTIIETTAKMYGAKVKLFDMSFGHQYQNFVRDFDQIEFIKCVDRQNSRDELLRLESAPAHIKSKPFYARDGRHPGALWQWDISQQIWNELIKDPWFASQ